MGKEAKLGLVFIGILLTVFSALLIKRMTRVGKLPTANSPIASNGRPDDLTARAAAPHQTSRVMVTPSAESSKPPELAGDAGTSGNDRNSLWQSSARNFNAQMQGANETSNNSTPSKASPPSLLGTRTPIPDVDSRYAATPEAAAIPSSPDSGRLREDTGEKSSTTVPYSSGYAAASDNGSTAGPNDNAPSQPADRSAKTAATGSQIAGSEPSDSYRRTSPQDTQPYAAYPAAGTEALRQYPAATIPASTAASSPPPTGGNTWSPASRNPIGGTTAAPMAGVDRYPTNERYPQSGPPRSGPATSSAGDYAPRATVPSAVMATPIPVGAIQRSGDQYAVQPNDSYWIISEKAYGTGAFFKALYEHNRKRSKDAHALKVGDVLVVPDEAILRRTYPDLCPRPRKTVASTQQRMISASARIRGAGRVYTVVDGDTLFEIARHELGKPSRWAEIYDLNRDALGEDFDYLRPGTELILPARPGSEPAVRGNTAVRQPEGIYPR